MSPTFVNIFSSQNPHDVISSDMYYSDPKTTFSASFGAKTYQPNKDSIAFCLKPLLPPSHFTCPVLRLGKLQKNCPLSFSGIERMNCVQHPPLYNFCPNILICINLYVNSNNTFKMKQKKYFLYRCSLTPKRTLIVENWDTNVICWARNTSCWSKKSKY